MTAQITLSMLIRPGSHPEGLKQLLQGTHTQKRVVMHTTLVKNCQIIQ